jgi:hypothetical protein
MKRVIKKCLSKMTKQDAQEWQDSTEKTIFFMDAMEVFGGVIIDSETPNFEYLRDEFEFGVEQILAQ